MTAKQTAGRDQLGDFAPKFAQLNDDVLFGEVWSRENALSLRDRSLTTVVSLMAQGLVDSSFEYHLATARQNGITKREIAEILTHAAFYAGWPKAWAAFRMARDVWSDDPDDGAHGPGGDARNSDNAPAAPASVRCTRTEHERDMPFPVGKPNDAFASYFTGQSYLAPISTGQAPVFNVTFEPGCRNN